eukprot:4226503-Pyramimonas_sp.AAC.1
MERGAVKIKHRLISAIAIFARALHCLEHLQGHHIAHLRPIDCGAQRAHPRRTHGASPLGVRCPWRVRDGRHGEPRVQE